MMWAERRAAFRDWWAKRRAKMRAARLKREKEYAEYKRWVDGLPPEYQPRRGPWLG